MSLIPQSRLIPLGLAAACVILTALHPARASVSPPSTPSLHGAWTSTWTVQGEEVPVALALREDGRYLLLILDNDGQVTQECEGRFTFTHVPQRLGLNAPAEGVLALEMRGHRIVEKVRWLGMDSFTFVGSEDHPWQRLHLSE